MRNGFTKILLIFLTITAGTQLLAQNTNDVGTPDGSFSVSNSGAAQYHIKIEAPDGGPLSPEVSIDYNSQSGYGLVGYGFNISGIQSITRGGKDLFHDNVKTGVKYDTGDAFFLSGVRLILESGTDGADGSTYMPEGNPYTKVTLHGSAASPNCWFSVITNDGISYEFGNGGNSRQTFTDRKGVSHVAAWHVYKVTDAHANYMTYTYTTSNYNIRPVRIDYGQNSVKSRGIVNRIIFNYTALPGPSTSLFAIGDCQGKMDVCLSSVITQTGNSVYRTYNFTYNSTSDATPHKIL